MSTDLAVLGATFDALSTIAGADTEFASFSRPKFLPRIQFYSKGNEQVAPGHWGIPLEGGKVVDLGAQIDVFPIARRMKAMDLSDMEHIIVTVDTIGDEYQRIRAEAERGTRDYLWGPSFLVVERSTGAMYELFCGSKTLSDPAKALIGYCPFTKSDCERQGRDVSDAHGPAPATLGSRKVDSKKYKSWWFVATCGACSLPLTKVPDSDAMVAEIGRFLTVEAGVEAVAAADAPTRAY